MAPSVGEMRLLLLQVRKPGDPMAAHERTCFARSLHLPETAITPWDLLAGPPSLQETETFDGLMIGGSGDYSATCDDPWFLKSMEFFREVHKSDVPTFGSCWGFQALARALGGEVRHDLQLAELGTGTVSLTEEARQDEIFAACHDPLCVQMGHEDAVTRLPDDAILLASSDRVTNQAFRIKDRPIYGCQFHPELRREDLLLRLQTYPTYVTKITGLSFDEFRKGCRESEEASGLLRSFANLVAKRRQVA